MPDGSEEMDGAVISLTERIALVLQGGGALGAFQVGVYQALEEAGCLPQWIAGTSIGAINGAILAGNAPEERLANLEKFWERVAWPEFGPVPPRGSESRRLYNSWSAWSTALLGQPGFFRARLLNPWFAPSGTPAATGYYDASELRDALMELVDFERLNSGAVRLSLGAVNVRTGQQVYFDNQSRRIGVEHVLASSALPPGFPPVEVDGEWYWDGGIVSNTPLDIVLDDQPRVDTLCFMVDLFDPHGPLPRTMDDVLARHKDIMYASRARHHIEEWQALHNMRRALDKLWSRLPPGAHEDAELQGLAGLGCTTTLQIVHILYRCNRYETAGMDHEFSRASLQAHRAVGYRDGRAAMQQAPWLQAAPEVGAVVHEVECYPDPEADEQP